MIVLGIASGSFERVDEVISRGVKAHDASAALIKDGQILAAAEEERFNRYKHSGKLPYGAIRHCLATARIGLGDVDKFVFSSMEDQFNFYLQAAYRNRFIDDFCYIRPFIHRLFRREFGCSVDPRRFEFVDHHYAHAMSAFVPSGFERALVVTLDGIGGDLSGSVWLGTAGKLSHIRSYDGRRAAATQSLGRLYSSITAYLGFGIFDEGKVMGLAAYGNRERFRSLFERLYELGDHGDYQIHLSNIDLFREICPPLNRSDVTDQRYRDLAAALQEAVERIALHIVSFYQRQTRTTHLCLAGGVAQNCVMNGRILREGPFDEVYVQPACHDGGLSLGAALHGCGEVRASGKMRSVMTHVYLGSSCGDDSDIERELHAWRDCIHYERTSQVAELTAQIIADRKVVGWVQGLAEFGPRALGNRSIVADPRPAENRDIINSMVKKREAFRPFAPSVLEEHAAEFFELPAARVDFSYMTFSVNVRERYRKLLGAITHVDGTARLQTVSRAVNERYWELIDAFGRLTGIPILLNTSFNNDAEPIVNDTMDAVVCYLTTNLDVLVIGNFIVRKKRYEPAVYRGFKLSLPNYARIQSTEAGPSRGDKAPATSELPSYGELPSGSHSKPASGGAEASSSAFYLDNTHDRRQIDVSGNLAHLLAAADGYTHLGEALKNFDRVEQDRLVEETLHLWARRWINLRPPPS